ncbi:response regulator transcription factor [Duganella sp. FT27W]|uniref:response regulator transcription factor n=1 Tax=Duganella sp. FT27W TaxID=2654636 RepID=UPI00128C4DBA|nr:response regulator [Duganella sp. FT27W]MPQ57034.1 response regulator [Duganella sp. FT27W]
MTPAKPPCVFLIDDDPFILRSVERLFFATSYVIEPYGSARLFLEHADLGRHGCIILDISMPDMPGPALQEHLLRCRSLLPIIFLTGNGDVANSVRAMKLGACDFLTKPVEADVLLDSVELALALNRKRLDERDLVGAIQARLGQLTRRERQVLDLVVAGRLNKQIAAELGTVEHTIKLHRASVMRKMAADSISDLVTAVNTLRLLRPEAE